MKFKKRAIIAGGIVEIFEYENHVRTGDDAIKFKRTGRAKDATEEEKKQNRVKVQARARSALRRLISANVGAYKDADGEPYKPKFITLTFAENITDTRTANREFKLFLKRLNYHLGCKLEYVVVVEFQKRGAVHYHVIFFNLPYIPAEELAKIWGQGFIRINAIEEVDNVGAYVSKYMGKEFEEDKLRGQKCYFSSRGLFKPIEIREEKEIEQLVSALSPFKKYESQFENEFLGQINYTQFNLEKKVILPS